jgi:hypothetical protein
VASEEVGLAVVVVPRSSSSGPARFTLSSSYRVSPYTTLKREVKEEDEIQAPR